MLFYATTHIDFMIDIIWNIRKEMKIGRTIYRFPSKLN